MDHDILPRQETSPTVGDDAVSSVVAELQRSFPNVLPPLNGNGSLAHVLKSCLALNAEELAAQRRNARSRDESALLAQKIALCEAVTHRLRPLLQPSTLTETHLDLPAMDDEMPDMSAGSRRFTTPVMPRTLAAEPAASPRPLAEPLPSFMRLNPCPAEGLWTALPANTEAYAVRNAWILRKQQEYRHAYQAKMRRLCMPARASTMYAAEHCDATQPATTMVIDLDAFVAQHRSDAAAPPDMHIGRQQGVYPHWLTAMPESVLTQFMDLLARDPKEKDLDAFFATRVVALADPAARFRVLRGILRDRERSKRERSEDHTMEMVRGRLKELEWLPETPGTYIRSPNYLRMKERDLLADDMRDIVRRHFQSSATTADDRTLMDIGAWDGHLGRRVARDLCAGIIAIEPDPTRFDKLNHRHEPGFSAICADVRDLAQDDAESASLRANVILLSHVLYFLRGEDDDALVLQWMKKQRLAGGIAIIALNDQNAVPGSRAHLRRAFRIRENSPPPSYYHGMLQRMGDIVDIRYPEIRLESRTPEGLEATRDVMRYLLPGDARHNADGLDAYIRRHVEGKGEDGQHVFRHNVAVLATHG
ncbi:MAG: hypothetical protein G01um101425_12 [Candidatus Peregrinibacteria bacterium Gr01-1014_25]|nr:MAG: hypothetical protein G01um101425_12 [Candidatus Peregrinibacteria bacterium Gr01-1014_25]